VRITIDTKADSPDELKHVISLLQAVVGNQPYTNYASQAALSSTPQTYSPMSIFSDDPPAGAPIQQPAMPAAPAQAQSSPTPDLFSMFSSSPQVSSSTPSTAYPSRPYHADDLLREASGDARNDDDDPPPDGGYELIPY
jgi:hypothetical protein